MNVRTVPVTTARLLDLAGRLRSLDVIEGEAMTGLPIREALVTTAARADVCDLFADSDGVVHGAAGLSRLTSTVGVPWFVCSTAALSIPGASRAICRHGLHLLRVEAPARGYSLLWNLVLAEHRQSRHWLRWLGFDVALSRPLFMGPHTFLPATYYVS